MMGRFRDAIRELQEDDPDFGKVRNAPGEGFAVDCEVPLREVLERGPDRAAAEITGIDDYGNPVSEIPLTWTSRVVLFSPEKCKSPLRTRPAIHSVFARSAGGPDFVPRQTRFCGFR